MTETADASNRKPGRTPGCAKKKKTKGVLIELHAVDELRCAVSKAHSAKTEEA